MGTSLFPLKKAMDFPVRCSPACYLNSEINLFLFFSKRELGSWSVYLKSGFLACIIRVS